MDNYKITQYSVNSILNFVEANQIAIPEIQRPFVWKGKEVKDLIDSLYEGYPIGYLIVWQNTQVRLRDFGKAGTKKILIDGQQRVTALMTALLGKEVLDEKYHSHRICIGFNPFAGEEEERFAVTDDTIREDSKWISDISVLFKKGFSYRKFEQEYLAKNPGLDTSGLETSIDTLRDIVKHQVGVIELSFLLDIDVVSEIFIRINLQGKPLNQEDFAMSKISANEQYNGDYIRNTIDYFCHLLKEPSFFQVIAQNEKDYLASEFGKALAWTAEGADSLYVPSYADMLKVVNIISFGKSRIGDLVYLLSGRTGKRGEISRKLAKKSFIALGEGVKSFVNKKYFLGFSKALSHAGYCCEKLLYSQSLLNYTYAMYLLMKKEGIDDQTAESLVGRWITFAMLTGHYQGAPDSVVARDCENISREGLASYVRQLEELRLTPDFFASVLPDRFKSTVARSAPFLAYLAAQCHNNAHSLYSKEVKVADLMKDKAESSQILPKAFLAKCGFKTREIYGQTANITYLDKPIKNLIKRKAPSDYQAILEKEISEEVITSTLKENQLDHSLFTVEKGQVEAFLEERRKNMAKALETYYYNL